MKKHLNRKRVYIFHRDDNRKARAWSANIARHVQKHGAIIAADPARADIVIALGGDGTILEAARLVNSKKAIVFGLNLGAVGFLASVRDEKRFLAAIDRFALGDFSILRRMMLNIQVVRDGRVRFSASALNEVLVQNLLGVMEIEAYIDGQPIQFVRGSGMLVSTATGSTAYNMSAHGPIVAPEIQCMILTELLDHNTPTPSIVIKPTHVIELRVRAFREQKMLVMGDGSGPVDSFVRADRGDMFPLMPGDAIKVSGSPLLLSFAEFEENYFFRSLREKFHFK